MSDEFDEKAKGLCERTLCSMEYGPCSSCEKIADALRECARASALRRENLVAQFFKCGHRAFDEYCGQCQAWRDYTKARSSPAAPPTAQGLSEEERERLGRIGARNDESQEFLDTRKKSGPECHYDREFLLGLVRRLLGEKP